ncbi:hypothetical protein A2U01_0027736 [Trifolium medium]|uniref:Uncharacterized protein n=1 Tax=Trifolium medium TaxID=97028 RepID=A0A392P607_9FABA|nr:hypothetical protein [Trifolium medium]
MHVSLTPYGIEKQLHYGEGAEQDRNHHHIEKNTSNSNQQDTEQCDQVNMTPFKEGEAKETTNLSPTQHRSCQTEKIEDGRLVSIDSRNSNQSEGSRGSFAFPE